MTPTAPCPGCKAKLPAPPQFAGQTVRCAACGLAFTLPKVVLDAVAVPTIAQPVHVPPPPPLRRDRHEEDDRPVRRSRMSGRPRKGFPVWMLVALGVFLVVLVGGVAGTAYLLSNRGMLDGGLFGDDWVKMAPPGTDVSWEFPTEPELGLAGPGGLAIGGAEDIYGCQVRQTGQPSIIFLVTISQHAAHDKLFPGGTIHDHALKGQPGGGDRFNQHLRKYDIQGRTANLFKQQVAEKVVLLVTEPGKTYRFEVFGPGVDENHAQVKRFLGSVKFGEARKVAGGPTAPVTPAEVLPTGWRRVTVPDSTLTVAMPNPSRNLSTHPRSSLKGEKVDGWFGATGRADAGIQFEAHVTVVAEDDGKVYNVPKEYQVKRVYRIEGREAHLFAYDSPLGPAHGSIVLLCVRFGNGKAAMLTAGGVGATPDKLEVRRFLDSVSFTLPAVGPAGR